MMSQTAAIRALEDATDYMVIRSLAAVIAYHISQDNAGEIADLAEYIVTGNHPSVRVEAIRRATLDHNFPAELHLIDTPETFGTSTPDEG